MPRNKLKKYGIAVLILVALVSLPMVNAQDLDIPGLEEATAPAASADAPGTTAKAEINLWTMIKAGGPTMIVLGLLSFAVIGLVVYGLIDLRKPNFVPDALLGSLKGDMEGLDLESARAKLQPDDNCLSAVMDAGIHYLSKKGYEVLETEKFEEVLGSANERFNRGRARTVNYFSIIAQASPMLGLLGTVAGMILAFGSLSSSGGGDPSVFADDISMALVTTASGLIVALPAIFAYFFMRDKLQTLVSQTDDAVEELIETLSDALAAYQHQEPQQ